MLLGYTKAIGGRVKIIEDKSSRINDIADIFAKRARYHRFIRRR